MGVDCARGALGSIACERLSVGAHARARARARGHPRGEIGRTARWGARSTRIAAFGLSCPPTPPKLCATPVFVFGLVGRHFVFFSFSCFPGFRLRQAPRVFCPAPIVENWGIGAPGDGTGRSKAFCVFDENKCSHQCRVHVRGERDRKARCRCSSPSLSLSLSHGKKKRELERKRKKKIHYRAP